MRKGLGAWGPLRVPLLGGAVLFLLPIAAILPGSASGLLRGLFDLAPLSRHDGTVVFAMRGALTCFCAFLAYGLAAVSVYHSASIILDFAPERLHSDPAPYAGRWLTTERAALPLVLVLLCLPALVAFAWVTLDRCEDVTAMIVGGAIGLLAVCWVFRVGMRRRARQVDPPVVGRLARSALEHRRSDAPGYTRSTPEAPGPDPLVHHAWAALFVGMSAVFWLFVAIWARWPWLQDWLRVPAVCSAMLLVMLSVWIFSGLTFFFDRHRFPILSVLLIVTALAGFRPHTFQPLAPRQPIHALLPDEVFVSRGSPSRIVVVAAAGGGIQAAAWTARVLRGIVRAADVEAKLEAKEGAPPSGDFLEHVVAVSGVSGGSVGLCPLVAAMHDATGARLHKRLRRALPAAGDSSLDPVAASFATSDLLPFVRLPDRGVALEESWKRAWAARGLEGGVRLSAVAAATADGRLPGMLFNATDMTTGERLVIGTTVPKVSKGSEPNGFVHAAHVSAGTEPNGTLTVDYEPRPLVPDLELASAARLSATFPFVTPASRCRECKKGSTEYVVDGGYIDNYGTESLVEWLEPLLVAHPDLTVDVVQIVSFPEGATAKGEESFWDRLPQSQLAAPIKAVLNVRTPGQGRRGIRDLEGLRDRFRDRVCPYRFVYGGCGDDLAAAPPLSWHLTVHQKNDLDDAWTGCKGSGQSRGGRASYEERAQYLVRHVLGKGRGHCAEVAPTRSAAAVHERVPHRMASRP